MIQSKKYYACGSWLDRGGWDMERCETLWSTLKNPEQCQETDIDSIFLRAPRSADRKNDVPFIPHNPHAFNPCE
jgi:hypothetical protein